MSFFTASASSVSPSLSISLLSICCVGTVAMMLRSVSLPVTITSSMCCTLSVRDCAFADRHPATIRPRRAVAMRPFRLSVLVIIVCSSCPSSETVGDIRNGRSSDLSARQRTAFPETVFQWHSVRLANGGLQQRDCSGLSPDSLFNHAVSEPIALLFRCQLTYI